MEFLDLLDPMKNWFGNCDFFINRFLFWSWADCCQAHDLLYINGGNEQMRQLADRLLGECVAECAKGAGPVITTIVGSIGALMAWATAKWGGKYWILKDKVEDEHR